MGPGAEEVVARMTQVLRQQIKDLSRHPAALARSNQSAGPNTTAVVAVTVDRVSAFVPAVAVRSPAASRPLHLRGMATGPGVGEKTTDTESREGSAHSSDRARARAIHDVLDLAEAIDRGKQAERRRAAG